MYKLLDSPR